MAGRLERRSAPFQLCRGAHERAARDLYAVLIPRAAIPHRFLTSRSLRPSTDQNRPEWEEAMLDILMLAIGAGLFVITIGYAYACDRL